MTRYLPDPRLRCSAYWYAQRAGMLPYGITDPDDIEFLRVLGARAALLARWHGCPQWRVPEGPFLVHMWPEWIFGQVADQMANEAAERGTWDDVIPPWCPLPQGDQGAP